MEHIRTRKCHNCNNDNQNDKRHFLFGDVDTTNLVELPAADWYLPDAAPSRLVSNLTQGVLADAQSNDPDVLYDTVCTGARIWWWLTLSRALIFAIRYRVSTLQACQLRYEATGYA